MKRKRPSRHPAPTADYGWGILLIGIVTSCIGIGTMTSLTVSLQPVSAQMGWSRAEVTAS